jgi:hypothetical protein
MSLVPKVIETYEGTDVVVMERIQDAAGANIAQAAFDPGSGGSITYYIYDEDDDTQETTSTLDRTAVVFDVLQTGAPWDSDSTGYNFKWQIGASLLPNATTSKIYRVDVVFLSTSSDRLVLRYRIGRTNLVSQSP